MSETNSGGPAFPGQSLPDKLGLCVLQEGMSLRDWFAGQALAGTLQASRDAFDNPSKAATWAVEFADALLAELQKEPDCPACRDGKAP